MATTQGTLALLTLYSRHLPVISLKECVVWTAALKAAGRKAKQEKAKQAKPATWADVERAIEMEKDNHVKFAILTAWLTCARVGCILQLRKEDVTETEKGLAVQFRRGKSVLARGMAYTVHTCRVPEMYRAKFQVFLSTKKGYLFPRVKGHKVKIALRRADPLLEKRSLRRGSLQLLARVGGLTLEQMLLFSGHTNVQMLNRYLNFGMLAPPKMISESAEAAAKMTLPLSVVLCPVLKVS